MWHDAVLIIDGTHSALSGYQQWSSSEKASSEIENGTFNSATMSSMSSSDPPCPIRLAAVACSKQQKGAAVNGFFSCNWLAASSSASSSLLPPAAFRFVWVACVPLTLSFPNCRPHILTTSQSHNLTTLQLPQARRPGRSASSHAIIFTHFSIDLALDCVFEWMWLHVHVNLPRFPLV